MKKALKVLIPIRNIMLIPVIIAIMQLGPAKQVGYSGILLYVLSFVFIILGIIGIILKDHNMNNSLLYNIIYVLTEISFVIMAYITGKSIDMMIFEQSYTYFQIAYLFISFMIILIMLNTYVVGRMKKKDLL